MARGRIAICLLGPVDIRVGGARLAVDTRKALAMLAYLAVAARPMSREALAALLWPEADDVAARGALRRTLSVLHSGLGRRGLAIDRSMISVTPGATTVDVAAFRELVAVAREHGHHPDDPCPTCIDALEAAVGLVRGEFMDGFALRDSEPFDDWQRSEAEALRRDRAAALERLSRAHLAAKSWDRAIAAARSWLDLDPLHEPAHRLLMMAYAKAGEAAAAVRQYRDCVRVLDLELGVAPLAETTALYDAIRTGAVGPGLTEGGVRADAPVRRAPEPDVARVLPLVGRERELERIEAVLRGIGPDGRLVVLEGEPGIGKTRLARTLIERRPRDARVLEARGYAGEAAIPYASIAELIRSGLAAPDAGARLGRVRPADLAEVARLVPLPGVVPRDPTPGDPLGRTRLLESLAEVLAALADGPEPGLVWLDDAHLADASSIEAIGFVARRLIDRPVALLLAWRREDLVPGTAETIIGPADIKGPTVITLRRLGGADVASLASAALGPGATPDVVDALLADSEGLPLYLAEALADPHGDPGRAHGTVDAMIRGRLASTSELATQVASAAAVIGRSFDLDTVREAAGRSEEETVLALEELTRRGLVRELATRDTPAIRYDFSHGRLRDVVYQDVGLARRRLLHRRVAESLRSSGPPRERHRWSVIAYHLQLAGDLQRAAEAHRAAGLEARSVYANREARDHFEAALALGHPDAAGLHRAVGEVLTVMGDYGPAIDHLDTAAALAAPQALAGIELQLGRVHARRGDWARAEANLAAALAATDPGADALRSEILADRSAVAHRRGDDDAAMSAAGAALAAAEAAGSDRAVARAEGVLGMLARRRGNLPSARRHLERALAVAASDGDADLRLAALNTLALVLGDAGDARAAIPQAEAALALSVRIGDRHREAAVENNLADLHRAAGDDDAAMEHLKRAVTIFAAVGGEAASREPEIWKLVEW